MTPLTLEAFADRVGTTFRAQAGEAEHELMLEAAEPLPSSPREGGGFRLLFRGPREPVLEQAIYPLRAGDESHEIFIVPIAQDPSGTQYEAVFF
jgi:hypothetical protein